MFGRHWHQLDPPNVLHWFAKKRLLDLLRQYGFEIVQQGRPVKWINFGNGVAVLRKSLSESKLISALTSPMRLVPTGVRIPYFFDDVFWIVARKLNGSTAFQPKWRAVKLESGRTVSLDSSCIKSTGTHISTGNCHLVIKFPMALE